MKKQGNMYPDVKTWNPLGGECPHKCGYCSTKSLMRYPAIKYKYSGSLRLFSDLHYLPKKPQTIFVCAQNDLFANDVQLSDVLRVLQACRNKPQHTYFFQTKNPARIKVFAMLLPEKTILCTTIETNRIDLKLSLAPDVYERASAMNEHHLAGFRIHVTIEPICDFDLWEMVELIKLCKPEKINIGADSKHHNLPEPSKEKLLALIEELQKFTTIDRKTNLARLLK